MDDFKEFLASKKSPRLTSLAKHIHEWFNSLTDEDFKDAESGIELIILGHDSKYKESFRFTIYHKDDPRESIVQAVNQGIGNMFEDEDSKEIFNGICEYFARLYAEYPKLYEIFKKNVKYFMKDESI